MQGSRGGFFGAHLRPQRQALALEPRILFDGAAASIGWPIRFANIDNRPAATQIYKRAPAS